MVAVNGVAKMFDTEIEKTERKLRKDAKAKKAKETKTASTSTKTKEEPKEEPMAENNNQIVRRTLGHYMTPARAPQTASIVRPQIEANNFELKPALLQLIQKEQFAGGSTVNPYCHLDDFLLYCDKLKVNGVSRDAILLRLFPCSLKDEARDWLQSQAEGSITSWDDLAAKFLARFFSASKMARLKVEITAFEQKESESLYEAWTRFKGLLRKCPQHGIEAWENARIFLQGKIANTRTLEAHATEDCEYIKNTEKQQQRPMHSGMIKRTRTTKEGINMQPPLSEWEKAFAQLFKTTSDYIQNSNSFREETRASFRNQEASIRNLETQIGQLSRQFTERTQGTFPSNTVVNQREHCNAITTRSGTVIQPVEKPPVEKKKEAKPEVEKEKEEEELEAEKCIPEKKLFKWEKKKALDRQPKAADPSPYAKVPYPQRLKQEVQKQRYTKFLDIFKKLQVNIPFAEALENMPNYARFMKDLLSRKRKLRECETVNLTEECNAISEKKLPTKVKDPRSFSIPCTIGKREVDNKLGITEVKPTKTIVQLADRSSKQAYGIIEDILVKVDKFIILVDFVILDIEEDATIAMIFGRPFLATSGALIDVLKGEKILRVDREQATFKFFDKEVPSSVAQPEDQVYYIGEKKDEHYGRTQFLNDGAWSSPSLCFEPP
ncbi:uncharacterized protein LOC133298561 [Gastrolobium bilobum]|uniref:uncharacterized protein LOC133298561 n=1 Tax=Gastrolobium bilobum TaxID=150636 RepID=UPI002AB261FF|nr:uncharacterized protein LOC133298561 [Gastrolobium bilobum]